jgi:hypothetical protein
VGLAALLAAWAVGTGESPRAAAPAPKAPAPVDFNRQVLPILSDHCFACHGPDEKKRKAKLRLDTKEGMFGELKSGGRAIVPGKLDESELIQRISSQDPGEVMPPAGKGKPLAPPQIELIKRWVEQGASWSQHWAFVPPRKPAPPAVSDPAWPRTPIDYFILARLDKEGLKPSPEAEKATLLRRVTLDLTGLPPTPAEIDASLADQSPDAYEKVVDRLLESPRYGEHLARYWLDAARYGDTHGLHLDNYREIWPYRDWVVRAFNANQPFDRFLVEQIAGDLLPNPTLDQVIATGYDRCHVSTSEGGSIEEEVYVRNVVDQVDTFGTVMLGLTTGCCRCHDHKYDPLTMKDYYSLFAFFNSIDGPALDGNAPAPPPFTRVGTPGQLAELDKLQKRVAEVRKQIDAEVAKVPLEESAEEAKPAAAKRVEYVWVEDDLPPKAKPGGTGPWEWVTEEQGPVFSGARASKRSAEGLGQHLFTDAQPGLIVGAGDMLFTYVYLDPANPPKEVMLQWNTGDWKHRAYWGENLIEFGADGTGERRHAGPLPKAGEWVRLEVPVKDVGLRAGMVVTGWAFTQFGGTVYWDRAGIVSRVPQGDVSFDSFAAWQGRYRAAGIATLPKPVQDALKVAADKRSDAQKKLLRSYFIENAYSKTRATFAPLHQRLADIEKQRDRLEKQMPTTLVFKEKSQLRQAYILKRGEYDRRGDPVGRATPAFLPPLPADAPRNRLGLARWLVAPEHPLTARVAVNRFWQQVFGTGLVKTAEDFGTQGEPPSHPELLDWLAVQFREEGWNVKALLKQMVMSATYRQSSRVTPEQLAKDPANRLLSRGPRFRLDAEALRDQALAVSGLLVEKLGGPGVKPPQPSGLWEAVGYLTSNTRNFTADKGAEKVHRRSLYTFWKRTAPPPVMSTFDAPSREACMVRRERTNTPLQALLMMNDTQYVESARALAERAIREGGAAAEERLAWMFRMATGRKPDADELAVLAATLKDHLAKYTSDVEAAKKLIAVGESKPDASLPPGELAAYAMVANMILNLDEVLTKG